MIDYKMLFFVFFCRWFHNRWFNNNRQFHKVNETFDLLETTDNFTQFFLPSNWSKQTNFCFHFCIQTDYFCFRFCICSSWKSAPAENLHSNRTSFQKILYIIHQTNLSNLSFFVLFLMRHLSSSTIILMNHHTRTTKRRDSPLWLTTIVTHHHCDSPDTVNHLYFSKMQDKY